MRNLVVLICAASILSACASSQPAAAPEQAKLAAAETMIDAFYSFDQARLRNALSSAPGSVPRIVFYQGWAEGGNYRVVERKACRAENAFEITCAITVKDDLIAALGTGYDVTDTFHLTFSDGKISGVRTTSNDPPVFEEALTWLKRERAELVSLPCRGFFDGGPTPGDCVKAVVRGFAEFAAQQSR